MQTEALSSILDRDVAKADAREVIQKASVMLVEIVNYATRAFGRCEKSATGSLDEDVAVLMVYSHIIRMTDGIQVLISECQPGGAIPLLRSAFEGLLSIEYILQDDTRYRERSLAWLVGNHRSELDRLALFDDSTEKGIQYKDIRESEGFEEMPMPSADDVKRNLLYHRRILSEDHLRPIAEKWEKERARYWYQLDEGPRNLRELATCVKRTTIYGYLYPLWSESTHVMTLQGLLRYKDVKKATVQPVRRGNEIYIVSQFAQILMNSATNDLIRKFRHDEWENHSKWFWENVYPKLRAMRLV